MLFRSNNINIIIADTVEEFQTAIKKCIQDETFSKMIAENGERLIEEKYNINAVARDLVDLYNKLP